MSGEERPFGWQAGPAEGAEGAAAGPAASPAPVEPERDPFWGYSDLFLFMGLGFPCMVLGWLLVRGVMSVFHLHATIRAAELVAEQFTFYGLLFFALGTIFRVLHDRPFWQS